MSSQILTETEVHLNDGDRDYHPGDKIEGTVKCRFLEDMNIQGIWVSLQGKEHTLRTKRHAGASNSIRKENVFLKKNKCLLAGEVTARNYEFTFIFELPTTIPGTYANKSGWIKYFIRVNFIMKPGNNDENLEVQNPFKVVSPIDLNTLATSTFMDPITIRKGKNMLPFLYFLNESIDIDAVFLKRAFVLGEEVTIEVKVFNRSNKKINQIDIILGQTITCKDIPYDTTKFDEVILKISNPEIISAFSHTDGPLVFSLKIPQHIELPNFSLCKLFGHSCWIKVVAILNSSDITWSIPIVLGHIPVRVEETSCPSSVSPPMSPPPRDLYPPPIHPPMPQPGGLNYCCPVHMPYLNTTPWMYDPERPHNYYPIPHPALPNPKPYPTKASVSRWGLMKWTMRAMVSTDRFSSPHSLPSPPIGTS